MTPSRQRQRAEAILDWFSAHAPSSKPELHYADAFQLLVAVVLSAQCTDARVNRVTPALFARFPTAEALAAADLQAVRNLIASVSYPNAKAAHLVALAGKLCAEFGGKVPSRTEELMRLPGVGRKTANVVASVIYNAPVIAVDTHVFRVAHRLGLSAGKTPTQVERDLEKLVPKSLRTDAHHWLLLHGRYVCTARKPRCAACGLSGLCPFLTCP